jgi:hypothetical protein
MAVRDLGDYIEDSAEDGSRTGTGTFIVRPRSFLIVGSLSQLLGDGGGPIDAKVHSFELFRRNLHEPEVITFDELLARAEWHVKLAEEQAAVGQDVEPRDHDGPESQAPAGQTAEAPQASTIDPWGSAGPGSALAQSSDPWGDDAPF